MHFQIHIDAPREKVWQVMLGTSTYPQWTDVFMPGSSFEGSWDQGSKMLFVALDENGQKQGMVARIAESRMSEFVSIEYLGQLVNGVEDLESEEAKRWAGGREEYTFEESGDGTELHVDVDIPDEFKDDMTEPWPRALEKLKMLAEA